MVARVSQLRFTTGADREVMVINIQLERPITPAELEELGRQVVAAATAAREGQLVALSGRMPVWAYSYLTHAVAHLVPALGVFDPKIGIVVVASHTPKWVTGETINVPEEVKARLLQSPPK